VQRSRAFGYLGDLCALGYAYSYLYFTATVVYALANRTQNYETLADQMGPAMTLHGAVMVFAGGGLAWAMFRSRLVPAWAALSLALGVVLVAATQGSPEGMQLLAAGLRDLGFAGMGLSLMRQPIARFVVPGAHSRVSAVGRAA
jgi:hypothetical protein